MSSIEVIEISEVSEKKRTVITGFPGVGFIGNTALMHMIKSMGFKQVAYVHGNLMPPLMVLLDGEPKHSFRIYIDSSEEIMFLVTEATVSGKSAWDIGQELMKWLKVKGVKEIISIEGFPFANPGEDIFGFTTGKANLREYGVQPIDQGAVSGISASMLEETIKDKTPWTTIFIPTRIVSGIDYKGAVSAIRVLNKMFNIEVNTEPLEQLSAAVANAAKSRQSRQEKKGGFLNRILPGEDL